MYYPYGKWNEETIGDRNKTKGCLRMCGKNNNTKMLQCDGCGRWTHFVCQDVTGDLMLLYMQRFVKKN